MIDGRIYKLKERLLEIPEHKWTIEEMCKIVGLSPVHFQRVFKLNVGMSPMAFLLHARLKKACYLLETTFIQIKQIGIQTGLINNSHLTRDFKNKYGTTPVEYRKRYWDALQGNAAVDKKRLDPPT